MKTKFNFNSQICTTREQSERLLALGFKKETADMMHYMNRWGVLATPWRDYHEGYKCYYPAWSLSRLWELTPKLIFTKPSLYLTMYEDSVVYCAEDNNEEYGKSFSRQISLFDNIIDCIEWLIKEGYFNEKYLV